MKRIILILSISFSLKICAQTITLHSGIKNANVTYDVYDPQNLFDAGLLLGFPAETGETSYLTEVERINLYNHNFFAQPTPPLLTTNLSDLEICTGNSTRLTASSNHTIFWYTTPPPIGSPVGTGTSYITPQLSTGYYTYYAVADNGGIKSDITAMEVVMVYPSPVLNIVSNVNTLCANETATLTVTGTTYYEWENGPVSSQIIIRPVNTQTYKVTGVNTAGCKTTAIYTQSVEACDSGMDVVSTRQYTAGSIQQTENNLSFSVYPNPNNGDFNIRVNSISENTHVEVYNWLGALVYSNKITSEITAVTLNNFPGGIYIVRIIENDTILKQEKIIKE